jgi:hypothetical protein
MGAVKRAAMYGRFAVLKLRFKFVKINGEIYLVEKPIVVPIFRAKAIRHNLQTHLAKVALLAKLETVSHIAAVKRRACDYDRFFCYEKLRRSPFLN